MRIRAFNVLVTGSVAGLPQQLSPSSTHAVAAAANRTVPVVTQIDQGGRAYNVSVRVSQQHSSRCQHRWLVLLLLLWQLLHLSTFLLCAAKDAASKNGSCLIY